LSKYQIKPSKFDNLRTYSLLERKSKVSLNKFAKVFRKGENFAKFIESLPDILAAKDFKKFILLMKEARKANKNIIFGLGAHVIKAGLSPIMIDLMEEGWVSGLALNGAGIIHDFELSLAGKTSENVEVQLKEGKFGMAKETGEFLNGAIKSAGSRGIGIGEAVGEMLEASNFPYKNISLIYSAYRLNIPVTVHVAIGTDIIHFHPSVDGEALGKASLHDFFLFCSLIEKIEGGGLYLNVGSAVILPEVFLKSISFIKNRGKKLENFTTAVFDFIYHYRPYQNVVRRPFRAGKKGFYFVGHHELMIPLLAAALKA